MLRFFFQIVSFQKLTIQLVKKQHWWRHVLLLLVNRRDSISSVLPLELIPTRPPSGAVAFFTNRAHALTGLMRGAASNTRGFLISPTKCKNITNIKQRWYLRQTKGEFACSLHSRQHTIHLDLKKARRELVDGEPRSWTTGHATGRALCIAGTHRTTAEFCIGLK